MKKRIQIEGMSCKNCSKRVEDALQKLENISKAKVSLKKKEAIVCFNKNIENNELKQIIETLGYQVISITEE